MQCAHQSIHFVLKIRNDVVFCFFKKIGFKSVFRTTAMPSQEGGDDKHQILFAEAADISREIRSDYDKIEL